MSDWLGSKGSALFSPLLPPGSDGDPADEYAAAAMDLAEDPAEDPAADPADDPAEDPAASGADDPANAETDDEPRDPQDALAAAAVRAMAHGAAQRDNSHVEKTRQRRALLERLQLRTRRVSRRVDGVSSAADRVLSRDVEVTEMGRAIDDDGEGEEAEGGRATDEDGSGEEEGEEEEEEGREKTSDGSMMIAGVISLLATAGVAVYLATLWDSLPAVMQVFVAVTFVWLYCALVMMVLQCTMSCEGQGEGETAAATWWAGWAAWWAVGDDAPFVPRGRSPTHVAVATSGGLLLLPRPLRSRGAPLFAFLSAHLVILLLAVSSLSEIGERGPASNPAPLVPEGDSIVRHRAAEAGQILQPHGQDAAPHGLAAASEGDEAAREPDAPLPRPGNLREQEELLEKYETLVREEIVAIGDYMRRSRERGRLGRPSQERGGGGRGGREGEGGGTLAS